jgi:hypothetical protein
LAILLKRKAIKKEQDLQIGRECTILCIEWKIAVRDERRNEYEVCAKRWGTHDKRISNRKGAG